MSLEDDIAAIARQEADLRFDRFDEDVAFGLGCLAREEGFRRHAPVVIDIRTPLRVLFAATLPGSTPDNGEWVRRKSNLVFRKEQSSYAVGRELEQKGRQLGDAIGLPDADFAAHGGAFPIRVKAAGMVACLTISGLPQREDHRMAVWAMCTALGLNPQTYDLPS